MKRVTGLLIVLACALATAGCGGGNAAQEKLRVEKNEAMKEFAVVLENTKDLEGAKAAKPKLEAIIVKLNDIEKRYRAAGSLKMDDVYALKKKYEKEEDEVMKRYGNAISQLSAHPEAYREMEPLIHKVMETHGQTGP